MRDKIKDIGLILALVIAGVSLPIGIIGFTRNRIVNNYYIENYYNTYIYGNNETKLEPRYYIETSTFINLTGNPEWFYDISYNLTSGYKIFFEANITDANVPFYCYIIQDCLFDIWNEGDRNQYYQIAIKSFTGGFTHFSFWIPESSGKWYFCWEVYNHFSEGVNITIKTIHT